MSETVAQVLGLLVILFLWWLGQKFDRAESNNRYVWDTTDEEAKEAAQFASWHAQRGESHLRLVSGGEYGTKDREAIRR